MEKYSLFSGRTANGTPLTHLVEPGSAYGINKTASGVGEHLPQVIELVESIAPQPGRLYIVNSALGAGEYVGVNMRGDWFSEAGLVHTPPGWNDIPVWDIDARRRAANHVEEAGKYGPIAWGYPTFYNAHRFRHHQNKDPNRAYGFILGAFYDHRMHRVVLVSELIRDLCETLGALDIYTRIERGEFVDTSMGCKVPSDFCLLCGNEARRQSEYCEHVREGAHPPYGMRSILPDGRVCGVLSKFPRFFDDSFVFIGAERSAKVMMNLTERVKGGRAYTQQLYPFVASHAKTAAAPKTAVEEQDARIAREFRILKQDVPEQTFDEKLSKILAGLPLKNDTERAAATQFSEEEKLRVKQTNGDVSAEQMDILRALGKRSFETKHRRPLTEFADLQKSIQAALAFSDTVKEGSDKFTSKFAEILKRIPSPTPAQISTIRSHVEKMPVLPDHVLSELAADPFHNLRAAARLGVVLRPEEFQNVLLRGQFPAEAQALQDANEVFTPAPITQALIGGSPSFHTEYAFPQEIMQRIRRLLESHLHMRSFAPAAVRIQIAILPRPTPTVMPAKCATSPMLDEVAELYNDYRAGLLAFPPNWRYVDLGATKLPTTSTLDNEIKLASDSQELSNWLLRLAFWPALFTG